MESYMDVTIHYLTKVFTTKAFTLKVTTLKGSHNGDYIRECWDESFAKFGLQKDNLYMIMRDNVSDGVKACNNQSVCRLDCIAHFIPLFVGPFFLEEGPSDSDKGSDSDDEEDDHAIDFENVVYLTNRAWKDDEDHVEAVGKLATRVRTIFKYLKNSVKAKEKLGT